MAFPLIPIAAAIIRIAASPPARMAIYTACRVGGQQILKHVTKSGLKRAAKSQVLKNPEKFGRRVYKKIEKKILERPIEQGQKNTIGASYLERSPKGDVFIKEGTNQGTTTNGGLFNIGEKAINRGTSNGTSSIINNPSSNQIRNYQSFGGKGIDPLGGTFQ